MQVKWFNTCANIKHTTCHVGASFLAFCIVSVVWLSTGNRGQLGTSKEPMSHGGCVTSFPEVFFWSHHPGNYFIPFYLKLELDTNI